MKENLKLERSKSMEEGQFHFQGEKQLYEFFLHYLYQLEHSKLNQNQF